MSRRGRPEKKADDRLVALGTWISRDLEDALLILGERYGKSKSEMARLLIKDALVRRPLTAAEIEARKAQRALEAERDGAEVVDLRKIDDLDELERRWRDTDSPPLVNPNLTAA